MELQQIIQINMENPKINDWFATRLLNNDKSIDFLLSEGINKEPTGKFS